MKKKKIPEKKVIALILYIEQYNKNLLSVCFEQIIVLDYGSEI